MLGSCSYGCSPSRSRARPTTSCSAVAQATEELGFDAFFRSDHYLRDGRGDGLPGPDRRLGDAGRRWRARRPADPARHAGDVGDVPAARARWRSAVAQVDAMSGGRVELGLGAGWYDAEHRAYGIPFPHARRAVRPAGGAAADHHRAVGRRRSARRSPSTGTHYTLADSPALPKPVQQPRPPIIIGGHGRASARRALAAQYADEFNIPFPDSVDDAAAQFDRVRAACEDVGRDPATPALLGRAGALLRPRRRGGASGGPRRSARTPTSSRGHGLAGTVGRGGRQDRASTPTPARSGIYLQTARPRRPRPPRAGRRRGGAPSRLTRLGTAVSSGPGRADALVNGDCGGRAP